MCPDRQIISLYLDGELPSPWKEKMEAHLESCPQCRAVLDGYGKLGEKLMCLSAKSENDFKDGLADESANGSGDISVDAAMERVWAKLDKTEQLSGKGIRRERPMRFRHRTITLPLPVAAATAAAILIIVVFFAVMGLRSPSPALSQEPMIAAGMGLDDHGIVPLDDMSEVLQYLSSQDSGVDFMVIRLPESRRFSRPGEPALINAADYSRTRRTISQ